MDFRGRTEGFGCVGSDGRQPLSVQCITVHEEAFASKSGGTAIKFIRPERIFLRSGIFVFLSKCRTDAGQLAF